MKMRKVQWVTKDQVFTTREAEDRHVLVILLDRHVLVILLVRHVHIYIYIIGH